MSLLPLILSDFDVDSYPISRQSRSRIDLNDILQPLVLASPFLRDWKNEDQDNSTVSVDKNKFQANVDVQQFKPEEITVKVNENTVTVEGKHEEKQDEHGSISRHFVRKYVLPKNCDMRKIESNLSSDGVLTIAAPTFDQKDDGSRVIPIMQTGHPVKKQRREQEVAVDNKNKRRKKSKL